MNNKTIHTKTAGIPGKVFNALMGGLGTYMMVDDGSAAVKDLSQGNVGSGLANAGIALLGAGMGGNSLAKAIRGSRLRSRGVNYQNAQNILSQGGRQTSTLLKPLHRSIQYMDKNPYARRMLSGVERFGLSRPMQFLNNPMKGQGIKSTLANTGAFMGLGMASDKMRNPGTVNPYTGEMVQHRYPMPVNPYRQVAQHV